MAAEGANMDGQDLRQRMYARLPCNSRWYDIRNQNDGRAVVRIYDEIGLFGVTEADFAAELDAISADEIEVQVSSPGGEVFAGIAIFNALRAHPARITTRVDGIAASAASVIVQAGDHRVMLSSAQMMIHEAWGLAIGPAADMRDMADLLDKQSDVLAGIYAERSGGDESAFRQMMADETWLTDQEAVDAGLADEIVNPRNEQESEEPERAAADADLSRVLASLDANVARLVDQLQTSPPAASSPTSIQIDGHAVERLTAQEGGEEPHEPALPDHEQAQRVLDALTIGNEKETP